MSRIQFSGCGVHPLEKPQRKTEFWTPDPGWRISLAFWLCLIAAAGLYALVALAPPSVTCLQLSATHYATQMRLVELEGEVERLARISEALTNEPAFAAELARVDFRAAVHAAEQIPVEPWLQLGTGAGPAVRTDPAVSLGWHATLLEAFASEPDVRRGTLAAAVVLALFAFGFLHAGHTEQAHALGRGLRGAAGRLAARYRSDGRPAKS